MFDEKKKRCFVYSFPFQFNLIAVKDYLSQMNTITEGEDVFYLSAHGGELFIFHYGVLVAWGLTEQEELNVCRQLRLCAGRLLGEVDDDLYSYSYGEYANIVDDHITLSNETVLSKLACSYGLAQSAKLGGFEKTIQKIVDITRHLPDNLAKKGQISLTRKEIMKLMGKIFIERSSINLHLELLDAPNFFWDHTELEPLHEMITEYMDQGNRMGILNQRLGVLQELTDILSTELNNQHSSKLEWIIIFLILAEVLLTVAKEIFHIF